ncbi:membrane protein insertion efficiency factor YidD [Candidatus Cyrtobacter comes]|uniref:membrane protein insertion efficiency factor YidD n=1 Tax=Candidatus Cyrtobacter comes TaxID=675776 RepID=UPI002ACE6BF8|nr:membrane protein insertion efficiency factor YidD [Candidatus Cyrtobacter comes]
MFFSVVKTAIIVLILAIICIYRYIISPVMPNVCRFTPSCSCYAAKVIRQEGFIGVLKAIRRVLCCNSFSSGGDDPV